MADRDAKAAVQDERVEVGRSGRAVAAPGEASGGTVVEREPGGQAADARPEVEFPAEHCRQTAWRRLR